MKSTYFKALVIIPALLFVRCDDVLDKENLAQINGDVVWNDIDVATGFLNEVYDRNQFAWSPTLSGNTDDAAPNVSNGNYVLSYGEVQPGSVNIYGSSYTRLREIHTLIEGIGKGTIAQEDQDLIVAQALFWRAKVYWDLVSAYGGVPIVLKVLQPEDELKVPRNTTTQCMTQIITDLDNAIAGLPSAYDNPGTNYGRITKGAAMAFKGRILMTFASELFDPAQSAGRWQTAYDALVAARTQLENNEGKGLHSSFSDLWFDESDANPEAVIVRRYSLDKPHNRDAGVRPFISGTDGESWEVPTASMVDAFPMKDGKSITDATSAYTYNATTFWLNRDPRFEASIAWNGANWPLVYDKPIRTSDIQWTFQKSTGNNEADGRLSLTSFYSRKAIDGSIPGGAPTKAIPTDYIEMRFAEVLLNIAEAANEIGKGAEAFNILAAIRQRAGIESGAGSRFGLAAGLESDKNAMREAVMGERRLELAFEGKRFDDLRRRRRLHTMNGMIRRGYILTTTGAFDALDPLGVYYDRQALEKRVLDGTVDLDDPADYTTYFITTQTSVERNGNSISDGDAFKYPEQYYFWDLPQADLNKNPSLVQNVGWPGGSFDPLK